MYFDQRRRYQRVYKKNSRERLNQRVKSYQNEERG
jgi:hypothetical protein